MEKIKLDEDMDIDKLCETFRENNISADILRNCADKLDTEDDNLFCHKNLPKPYEISDISQLKIPDFAFLRKTIGMK